MTLTTTTTTAKEQNVSSQEARAAALATKNAKHAAHAAHVDHDPQSLPPNTTYLDDVGGSWMAHELARDLQEKEDLQAATHLQQEEIFRQQRADLQERQGQARRQQAAHRAYRHNSHAAAPGLQRAAAAAAAAAAATTYLQKKKAQPENSVVHHWEKNKWLYFVVLWLAFCLWPDAPSAYDLNKAIIRDDLSAVQRYVHGTWYQPSTVDPNALYFDEHVLPLAASKGNVAVVQELLAAGAALEGKGYNGRTALVESVYHGHQDMVQLLLNAGAAFNTTVTGPSRDFSKTPLMLAANAGNLKIVKVLTDKASKKNLDNKCRSSFCMGKTALLLAAEAQHHEIVQLLLEANADPNAVDRNGRGVVHIAVQRGSLNLLELLVQHHANLDLKTHRFNRTALFIAVNEHTRSSRGSMFQVPSEKRCLLRPCVKLATRRSIIELLVKGNADVTMKETLFKRDVIELSQMTGYSCMDLNDVTASKLCPFWWQRMTRAMAPSLHKIL